MKRLLLNIFCCFIPFKKARKAFRKWVKNVLFGEFFVDRMMLAQKKHLGFNNHKNNIKTIALGSSHGYYGFCVDNQSFNLCENSQDLYYSYSLYKNFVSDLDNVKNIILFYSVFSHGLEINKTSEKERCLYYKMFWKIPLREPVEESLKNTEKHILNYLKKHPVEVDSQYLGNCDYGVFRPLLVDVEERVNSHMKNNLRHNNQTNFVAQIVKDAKEQAKKVIIVIPPQRSDYMAFLPSYEDVYSELLSLNYDKDTLKILNFFDDSSFSDDDFGDMDHLNNKGAEKLTAKIYSEVS